VRLVFLHGGAVDPAGSSVWPGGLLSGRCSRFALSYRLIPCGAFSVHGTCGMWGTLGCWLWFNKTKACSTAMGFGQFGYIRSFGVSGLRHLRPFVHPPCDLWSVAFGRSPEVFRVSESERNEGLGHSASTAWRAFIRISSPSCGLIGSTPVWLLCTTASAVGFFCAKPLGFVPHRCQRTL